MIHELKGKVPWAPRRMVNEIIRWILGLHSPTGTVRIGNNPAPTGGRSLSLDVDMRAVASEMRQLMAGEPLGDTAMENVRDVVKAMLDGETLRIKDKNIAVPDDLFAPIDHTHSGYAAADHTHSNYADVNHTHSDYAEVNHTHDISDLDDSNDLLSQAPENTASRTSFGGTDEGSGSSAESGSWTYGGVSGVSLYVCTRVRYDDTESTPKLYGYCRQLNFDKNGKLYSVGAEQRYVIDQPVEIS